MAKTFFGVQRESFSFETHKTSSTVYVTYVGQDSVVSVSNEKLSKRTLRLPCQCRPAEILQLDLNQSAYE
jgi:hypothetical protein